jgi:ATP-dependent RNA helicase HelY
LRAAARAERLARQVDRLESQARSRSESLARQLDRVLGLLERWGYAKSWALTPAGERLCHLYHEQDLLVAECAERGLLDGLKPAEMAALVSVFTYEARGPAAAGPAPVARMPNRRLSERWEAVEAVAASLAVAEDAAGLPGTRAPDPGFAVVAHAWAMGKSLATLVTNGEVPADGPSGAGSISAGDFVRNIKQLIDLLRQLGDTLADQASAGAALEAAAALFRGVVAASSVMSAAGT